MATEPQRQYRYLEARRAEREIPEYQEGLARDIDAYRREYPPVGDPELIAALRRNPPVEPRPLSRPRPGQESLP